MIVTENMFGDILSDEAGAIVGSLGLLPSASLGDGTGPVRAGARLGAGHRGPGLANPLGAILSAAMLLRHALSLETEAAAVEAAVGAAHRCAAPHARHRRHRILQRGRSSRRRAGAPAVGMDC